MARRSFERRYVALVRDHISPVIGARVFLSAHVPVGEVTAIEVCDDESDGNRRTVVVTQVSAVVHAKAEVQIETAVGRSVYTPELSEHHEHPAIEEPEETP